MRSNQINITASYATKHKEAGVHGGGLHYEEITFIDIVFLSRSQ
jgi:hypothetical protein